MLLASMVPTLLLAAAVLYTQWHTHTRGQGLVEERGRLLAQSLSDAAVVGVIARDIASLQRLTRAFAARHPEIVGIEIVGRTDDLLVRFVPNFESARNGIASQLTPTAAHPIFREEVRVDAAPLDLEIFAISDASERVGTSKLGAVALAIDVGALGTDISQQQWPVIIAVLVVLLLSVVAGRYLVSWSITPLKGALASLRVAGHENGRVATDVEVLKRAVTVVTETREAQLARLKTQLAEQTQSLRNSLDRERVGHAERRQLIQKINATIEDERRSIASELHDELGAAFTVIRLRAEHITRLCANSGLPSPSPSPPLAMLDIKTNAGEIATMSKNVYASVRRIVRQLRPETLEMLGLTATLHDLADLYSEAQGNKTRFNARVNSDCDRAAAPVQMAVYRLVQEAFTNVAKHADARNCELVVESRLGGTVLEIVIQDDGVGLPLLSMKPRGLGLIGMAERMEALDGKLVFSSPPGDRGTIITATLPMA